MEVWYQSHIIKNRFLYHNRKIVTLVHAYLGLAAVVKVTDVPEREGLELETAHGSIVVNYDLTHTLD